MAQGKKLTKAQKAVVEKLHSVGQLGLLDVIGQPRDNLYDAGIIEWVETTSDDGYFQLTTAGQALAVSLFGSNAPADTSTSTPETVASAAPEAAPETAQADPVAESETVFTTRYGSPVELLGWYEQDVLVNVRYADGEENEAYISDLRAPGGLSQIMDYLNNKSVVRYLVANNFIDTDPMEFDSPHDILEHLKEYEADGDSMAGYQVIVMRGADMIESLRADNWLYGYSSPPIADPPVNPIWTHNADDTPFPFITDWRKCHQAAWLFAERGAVTGHGRKAKSTVKGQKRVKSQSVVQLANMERKSPKIAQIGANRGVPVSVLPQMTRALETRKRAA